MLDLPLLNTFAMGHIMIVSEKLVARRKKPTVASREMAVIRV